MATQGLGAAIITQIGGTPQFNQWFIYVLLVFVITTLLVEIVYLNKALNLFNAALVTPTYYVIFTSATIVTSAILFRGFKGSASSIATVVMGFLQICSGVVLLQLSKSSKNVPDTEIFRGDLDQIRTVAEQSEPESEPKADAIRGTAAIIRRFSVARQMAEADEARKIHAGRMRDLSTPQTVGESVEWDGVRRRVTWTGQRRNTLSGQHPPLGMSKIPDEEEGLPETSVPTGRRRSMSVDEAMRQHVYGSGLPDEQDPHPETFIGRMRGLFIPNQQSRTSLHDEAMQDIPSATTPEITSANNPYRPRHHTDAGPTAPFIELPPISQSSPQVNRVTFHDPQALAEEPVRAHDFAPTIIPRVRPVSSSGNTDYQPVPARAISPPSASPALRPGSGSSARRQFSFQFLHRHQHSAGSLESTGETGKAWKNTVPAGKTEEELMGLVKGDSVSSSSSAHVREVADGACSSDEDNPAGWREKDWESRGEKK